MPRRIAPVAALIASLAVQAHASLLTFHFCGTVDVVSTWNTPPAPFNTVTVGSSWTLDYTFDPAALDAQPGNPNMGWYDPSITSYLSTVGSVLLNRTIATDTDTTNSIIHVASNQNVGDGYFVYLPFSSVGPSGTPNAQLAVWLQDYTGVAWNGHIPRDGLKTSLSLSDFQSARFKFAFSAPNGGGSLVNMIEGRVDCFAVTPAPGTAAAFALFGAIASRRRRPATIA